MLQQKYKTVLHLAYVCVSVSTVGLGEKSSMICALRV